MKRTALVWRVYRDQSNVIPLWCRQGVGGGGAYPLTKQYFQLKNDKITFKMGNQEECYLLLPCLLAYGKRLPAYHTAYILGIGGNNT